MTTQVFYDVSAKNLDDIIDQYNAVVRRLRAVPPQRWTKEERQRFTAIARTVIDGSDAMRVAKMQHKFVEMDNLLVDLTQRPR
jgi:hypothetical protein